MLKKDSTTDYSHQNNTSSTPEQLKILSYYAKDASPQPPEIRQPSPSSESPERKQCTGNPEDQRLTPDLKIARNLTGKGQSDRSPTSSTASLPSEAYERFQLEQGYVGKT